MTTETDYGINAYKQGSSAERSSLIKELVYSEHSDKINLLKTFYLEESDLQIKFDIRKALDDLESSQKPIINNQTGSDNKIRKVLESSDANMRHKALSSIVKNRRADLLPLLKEINVKINDVFFEAAIVKLLSLNTVSNFKEILTFLDSSDDRVVATTVEILGQVGNSQSVELVAKHLTHENNRVRSNAAVALAKSNPALARETIIKMSRSEQTAYRSSAAYALSLVEFADRDQILQALINDEDQRVKHLAQKISQKIGSSTVTSFDVSPAAESHSSGQDISTLDGLKNALSSTADNRKIASLLRHFGDYDASAEEKLKVLKPYLQHSDGRVRANAVEIAAQLYSRSQLGIFKDFLKDENNRVIGNAISVL